MEIKMIVSGENQEEYIVLGLGVDGQVYRWVCNKKEGGEWILYVNH